MFEVLQGESFHFLRPWWFAALIPAFAVLWYWLRRQRTITHWTENIDPALLNVLLEGDNQSAQKLAWLPWVLGVCITVTALSGPAWQRIPQPVSQRGDALVILLDLSLSMYAEDTPPSRIERAHQEITDILRSRTEGFTALVAFAGDAHVVAPLTDDTRTIINLLGALYPAMMPVPGSDPDSALTVAHTLLANARAPQGRILIVGDAVDDLNAVARHRDPRFPVSVLGIGTSSGGTIPLHFVNQPGRHLQTEDGDTVIAKLDTARLEAAAEMGYGHFASATLSDDDIEYVLSTRLPGENDDIEVRREFDSWQDNGVFLAFLLLPLMLFAFRRGIVIAILLPGCSAWLLAGVMLVTPFADAQAGLWDDLWYRADQQGYQALQHGEPEQAGVLFEDPQWRGAAQYRADDFESSAKQFRDEAARTELPKGDQIRNLYNLGNALARLGDYPGAIETYQQVLAQEPEHEDAAFNKALLEKLQEAQQQASDQSQDEQQQDGSNSDAEQQQQQQEGGEGEESDSPENQQSQQSQQQEGDQQQSESQSDSSANDAGEPQEAEATEEERDAARDAMEQWLRRVPDDPGGLLRRKFKHESNQRLRRGEVQRSRGDRIW